MTNIFLKCLLYAKIMPGTFFILAYRTKYFNSHFAKKVTAQGHTAS